MTDRRRAPSLLSRGSSTERLPQNWNQRFLHQVNGGNDGVVVPAFGPQAATLPDALTRGFAVLSAQWGPSVSKNPFMQFTVKGAKAGDKIAVTWTDNKGDKRTDEATVS